MAIQTDLLQITVNSTPVNGGTVGEFLQIGAGGVVTSAAAGGGLEVGVTTITSGTDKTFLYNDGGTLEDTDVARVYYDKTNGVLAADRIGSTGQISFRVGALTTQRFYMDSNEFFLDRRILLSASATLESTATDGVVQQQYATGRKYMTWEDYLGTNIHDIDTTGDWRFNLQGTEYVYFDGATGAFYVRTSGGNNIFVMHDNAFTSASGFGVTLTQGGIGGGSNQAFEVNSTVGGLRVPRMTTTQRNALTQEQGTIIFNTTTVQFEGYDGTTWNAL